jgi:hypothetical protein
MGLWGPNRTHLVLTYCFVFVEGVKVNKIAKSRGAQVGAKWGKWGLQSFDTQENKWEM